MTCYKRFLLLSIPSAISFLAAGPGPANAHDVIGSHLHRDPDDAEPEMSFTNIDGSHHHGHDQHRRHRHLEEEPQPSPEPGEDWYEGSEVDDPFSDASFEACGTEDMPDEEIFLAQELEVEFWEQQNQRPSFFQAVWDLIRFGILGNRNGARRRRALQNLLDSIGGIGGGGGGGGGGGQGIPTYYHVIQPSGGSSYTPTDARIREQHQILNDAYSGIFSFELKEITRTTNSAWYDYPSSAIGSSSGDMPMKQALRRGGTESLNVYLNKGAGYCGYAYYPSAAQSNLARDGVVLNERCFPGSGSTDKLGDTLVHEVGHFMGLPHTFQNGCNYPGDGVDDTPYEKEANRDCNVFAANTRDTCPSSPGLDPINNYMDYSPDACRREFTAGQKSRMLSEFKNYRS